MRKSAMLAVCLVLAVVALHQVEAGTKFKLKKLLKYGLIANALTGKKILLPLPLPLPIPVFQENVHHVPYQVHHHTHENIGFEQYGFAQGGYGAGGLAGGIHGGGYGGGYGVGHGGGYGGW